METSELWAILPSWCEKIVHAADPATLPVEAAGRQKTRAGQAVTQDDNIAVLSIRGPLTQHPTFWQEMFGALSMEDIGRVFAGLVDDPSIKTIILDFDSPGGTYAGTVELAERVVAARGEKRIIAVSNGLLASAAYWIGSAASEIVASPSSETGSIGVVAVHYDLSAANEKVGVKPTYVVSSANKAEFNPDSPLSSEAQAELQRRVDEAGGEFTRAVARNRGVSPSTVAMRFGQGRTLSAKAALAAGMVDGIASLDDVIGQVAKERDQRRARVAGERAKLAAMATQAYCETDHEIFLDEREAAKAPAATSRPMTAAEARAERKRFRASHPEVFGHPGFVHDYR
jgi:signal peptide peptidase SppA